MKIYWTELCSYQSDVDEATLRELIGEPDKGIEEIAAQLSTDDDLPQDLDSWLADRSADDFFAVAERRVEDMDLGCDEGR